MRLWLDTDIGSDVDDAVALLCALRHPQVELVGVSTVHRRVEARAWLAQEMVTRAGALGVLVLPGAMATFNGVYKEGEGIPCQAQIGPAFEELSVEDDPGRLADIAQAMAAVSHPFHLLTVGALTNIAHLVSLHPAIADHWLSVTCMGGRLEGEAEYNVACDPAAARIVFERLAPRVVGIEACSDVLTRGEAEASLDAQDPASAFLLDCYREYRAHAKWLQDPETAPLTLFDAITLLSLVHEDVFDFQQLRVLVEKDGRLRLTDDGAAVEYASSSEWGRLKPSITSLLREQMP